MDIRKVSKFIGLIAGIVSIFLWIVLIYFNPYSNLDQFETIMNTFLTLFLPACLAIAASLTDKYIFMLIAFLWSFPISLYMALTPSVFLLFGITNISYLISFLFMRFVVKKRANIL